MMGLRIEQLEQLDNAWAERGAVVRSFYLPGLSEERIRAIVASADPTLVLPDELVRWWGWHNGAPGAMLSEARAYFSLEQALDAYAVRREVGDPHVTLLPITDEAPDLVVECGAGRAAAGRVFTHHADSEPSLVCDSMGELVDHWLGFLGTGAWTFDASGWPVTNWDLIPHGLGG